tara:strand:- start:759 stop:1670 length:912 start_codon:yes stop_codon:yes gene_type:complete
MSYKIIYCDGDSWTAGDLLDPKLEKKGINWVNDPLNDNYRLPKVWPHKLGKIFNNHWPLCDTEIKNNSVAGSSNDGIVRRVLDSIPKLLRQYKPEELCVIIGWTSPERKDFFTKATGAGMLSHDTRGGGLWETLYPAELTQKQINKDVEDFYKIYLKYFWKIEEFSNRYIEQNLLLHHYLNNLGINHYFFNAFYESSGENFNGSLYQKYFITKRRGLPDEFGQEYIDELKNVHGIMDELLFDEFQKIFKSNFLPLSFKKYCDVIEPTWSKRYTMNHPNEKMHDEWSKYIYKQIFTKDGYFHEN